MTLVSETLHKQNHCGKHKVARIEKPTDSLQWFFIILQFNLAIQFQKLGHFAVYNKDFWNVWTPRKHATDAMRWISNDNPAKISHNNFIHNYANV